MNAALFIFPIVLSVVQSIDFSTNVEITDLRVWHCDDSNVLSLATRILAEDTNVTRIRTRIIDAINSDPVLSEKNQVDWSVMCLRYGRTVANLTPLRDGISKTYSSNEPNPNFCYITRVSADILLIIARIF